MMAFLIFMNFSNKQYRFEIKSYKNRIFEEYELKKAMHMPSRGN